MIICALNQMNSLMGMKCSNVHIAQTVIIVHRLRATVSSTPRGHCIKVGSQLQLVSKCIKQHANAS